MGHQGNSQPHVCLPASTSDLQGNWRGHTELMESPLGRFTALLSRLCHFWHHYSAPRQLPLASGLLCPCSPVSLTAAPSLLPSPRMWAPLAWAWHASRTVALLGVGFDSFIHFYFSATPRHLQDLSFTSRD